MPVGFLTQEQRDRFGRFVDAPSREELERYFHLSDDDHKTFQSLRGNHNRLGYATQLTTVRYLGTFPDDFSIVPPAVLQTLCRQLSILDPTCIQVYATTRQLLDHFNLKSLSELPPLAELVDLNVSHPQLELGELDPPTTPLTREHP